MRKRRFNLALKLTVSSVIIFFVFYFIISYILKALKNYDYFKIEEIVTREDNNLGELSFLRGRNIFSVDLRSTSRYILESHSDCSSVRLIRILPKRIFVDFIRRRPLAFVKLYRYFALDEDGVLFYAPGSTEELELPLILGLETKIFGPKPGTRYNTKEIALALDIIKENKRNKTLRNYRIKTIDLSNLTDVSLVMILAKMKPGFSGKGAITTESENLEIRLSEDNIRNKISTLASLIAAEKLDLGSIKYIDLRFKDPVIKLKDNKR